MGMGVDIGVVSVMMAWVSGMGRGVVEFGRWCGTG